MPKRGGKEIQMTAYAIEIIIAVISMLGTASGAYFANKKSTALVACRLAQ